MLASRAIVSDPLADRDRTGEADGDRTIHPLIVSIAPALDTAFGLEPAALLPEPIHALIAALEAGPLGPRAHTVQPLAFA